MEFVSIINDSTMGAAGGTANFNDNQTAPQLDCGLDYRDFVPPDGGEWEDLIKKNQTDVVGGNTNFPVFSFLYSWTKLF